MPPQKNFRRTLTNEKLTAINMLNSKGIILKECNFEDVNKTYEEKKNELELHKNTTSYFEQILDAIPYEATAIWPLPSHLKNHPSKTNKTCGTLLKKQG